MRTIAFGKRGNPVLTYPRCPFSGSAGRTARVPPIRQEIDVGVTENILESFLILPPADLGHGATFHVVDDAATDKSVYQHTASLNRCNRSTRPAIPRNVIASTPAESTQTSQHDRERWNDLTKRVLPELARHHRWPLRLDHCFQRVCLDYAFGNVWYGHLAKPALRHIQPDALQRAIACAEEIVAEGEPLLRLRNQESLRYRGKLKSPDATASKPPRTAAE